MPDPYVFESFKSLLAELGSPEKDFRAIHVAGTNGKGSTSVMIASVLEKAGYKVGLYTSPHLETECERAQIWDGEHRMISQTRYDELKARVEACVRAKKEDPDADGYIREGCVTERQPAIKLNFFMLYTAAAFLFFAEEKPDYVVLECGLGGRLDMTNAPEKPLVSVITQIGLDHTAELGDTILKVASEKAGIMKPGVPVVSQSADPAVKKLIRSAAEEKGSRFIDASACTDDFREYELGMSGEHQVRNAATAVLAVRAAGIEVSEEAVRRGLAEAVLPGRFEVLSEKPYIIIDGSHNPDAVEALTRTFEVFARDNKIKRTLVIFGCMKDKNYRDMIQLLTEKMKGCSFASAAVDFFRAEDPHILAGCFEENGKECVCYGSAQEAFEDALSADFECVLITGSIYLAGAARGYHLMHGRNDQI